MKKFIAVLLITLVFLGGCQGAGNNIPSKSIFIKDDQGSILVTESDLASASFTEYENGNGILITVIFKDANKMKEISESQLNKKLDIYLGDKLLSSPLISTVLESDAISISGNFSKEDAQEFISIINN